MLAYPGGCTRRIPSSTAQTNASYTLLSNHSIATTPQTAAKTHLTISSSTASTTPPPVCRPSGVRGIVASVVTVISGAAASTEAGDEALLLSSSSMSIARERRVLSQLLSTSVADLELAVEGFDPGVHMIQPLLVALNLLTYGEGKP